MRLFVMPGFANTILICSLIITLFGFSLETDAPPADSDYMSIKKLRTKFFTNYNKSDRPVQDHSNTTRVNFTFAVAYTFAYEERNETFALEGFIRLKWNDSRWIWNPDDYGGIDFFQVEADECWLPDIGIYESVPAQMMTNQQKTRPMVLPHGLVVWAPRATFKTLCPFKADNYPQDIQVCNMTFGSWNDGISIDLHVGTKRVYLGRAINNINNKWKLIGFEVNRVVSYRTEDANPFVNIVVTTKFQRVPPVEYKVVAPPTVVATILMLSMFWLPPSSEKKLTLGASALFMLLGLLLYVAASTRSPLVIGVAVSPIRSVIFITISALLSEIIVVIISKLMVPPPPSLKNVIDGNLGKILFLNSPNEPAYNEELQVQEKSGPEDTWYKTAMATDRFFFVLFVVIVILNQIF